MMGSLYSGITGLRANKEAMNVIGDNIANSNTPGFKSARLSFANVLNQTIARNTGDFSHNQIGNGVQIARVNYSWLQGSQETTGNMTDLSISGNGFFIVNDSDGSSYYTRAGNFGFDKDGQLVNPFGYITQGYDLIANPVLPDPPPDPVNITIDLDRYKNIYVDQEGIFYGIDSTIAEGDPGYGEQVALYQVSLAEFKNITDLGKLGENLWAATSGSGVASHGTPGSGNFGDVTPGTLELSNVDLATEFVNMIVAQRAFQANSRVITTSDEMLQELISIKR